MKRYVNLVIVATLFCGGLYGVSPSTNPVRVRPVGADENTIVEAIKGRSDITQEDVDRTKLLSVSYPTMTLAGQIDWHRFNLYHLNIVLESIPVGAAFGVGSWVLAMVLLPPSDTGNSVLFAKSTDMLAKTLVLAKACTMSAVGGLGTYIASSKLIYPRIRCGVLHKVQRFIDVCEGLIPETIVAGHHVSIAHVCFKDKDALLSNLPDGWMVGTKAVTCALTNLVEQGNRAIALLNQVGTDVDFERVAVSFYLINLEHNLRLLTEKKDDKK